MNKIVIAGFVTLYKQSKDIEDITKSYIDYIDKLYVIDNNENIDRKDEFKNNKKIKYIANKDNLGIATSLNMACKEAIKDGYHFLLTMDQDSEFNKDSLDKMIKYVRDNDMSKIGILSPYHVTKNKVEKPKEKIEDMVEVMTSGNILNLDIYKKIGGFIDDYFIDCVDQEYCMRLNKLGYIVRRLNCCELVHEIGNITSHKIGKRVISTMNHNYIRKYYITRNTLYLCDLYEKDFPERCLYLKKGIPSMIKKVLLFEKGKYKKLRSIYRGIKDYKKNIMGKYNYKN